MLFLFKFINHKYFKEKPPGSIRWSQGAVYSTGPFIASGYVLTGVRRGQGAGVGRSEGRGIKIIGRLSCVQGKALREQGKSSGPFHRGSPLVWDFFWSGFPVGRLHFLNIGWSCSSSIFTICDKSDFLENIECPQSFFSLWKLIIFFYRKPISLDSRVIYNYFLIYVKSFLYFF